jgi:diguanylate cyclase (GGDEF)-like protein
VRYRSEHDALTGLKNRASSDAALERYIADAIDNAAPLSVLCIDLDGFKQVNDEFGHHAGDQVLIACAKRMQAAVRRSSDLVGRLGGDEFVVALREVGPSDRALCLTAAALLEALRAAVVLDDGTQVWIGASIGIACLPHHGSSRASLVHAADAAMYEIKRSGRNSFAMAIGPPPARRAADTPAA